MKRFCLHPVACLSVVLVPAVCLGQFSPENPRGGTVTANVLNVRAKPATHYEVIAKLDEGDRVQVVGESETWLQILVAADAKAYVAARYVSADGKISGDRVRVHSGPGLVFTTYAYVSESDTVECIGEPKNEWQQIAAPKGSSAWVSREFIELDPLPPPPEDTDQQSAVAGTDTDPAPADDVPETKDDTAKTDDDQEQPAVAADAQAEVTPVAPPVLDAAPDDKLPDNGTAAAKPVVTVRNGVVFSLHDKASRLATHLLAERTPEGSRAVCFLVSSDVDLTEWERREVRLYGRERKYEELPRSVMEVTGIQILLQKR